MSRRQLTENNPGLEIKTIQNKQKTTTTRAQIVRAVRIVLSENNPDLGVLTQQTNKRIFSFFFFMP